MDEKETEEYLMKEMAKVFGVEFKKMFHEIKETTETRYRLTVEQLNRIETKLNLALKDK